MAAKNETIVKLDGQLYRVKGRVVSKLVNCKFSPLMDQNGNVADRIRNLVQF